LPGLIRDGYVIDTCAIIDLWHQYPSKTFASLWTRFEKLAQEGRLLCPGQVLAELRRKDDDASDWLEKRKTMIVVKEDVHVWNLAQRVAAAHPGLVDHSRTIPQADPYVIALAGSLGWTVVTSERSKGFGVVNIPSVCRKQSVPCLNLLEFFAKEGWRL
jgi:predicted nucleic acid-binding protein